MIAPEVHLETWTGNDQAMARANSTCAAIDVLLNTVGGAIWKRPFQHFDKKQLMAGIKRSLSPAPFDCRAALPCMPEQGRDAIVTCVLAIPFGAMAPTFKQLMLAAPRSLIMTLAGLAMLRTLHGGFMASFRGPFSFGAMTGFVVTVADLPILNIGSAFWGVVTGLAVSLLGERQDFRPRV